MGIKRYDIYLASPDPTLGSEIQKTRPCMVVSPEAQNNRLATVILVPLTTSRRNYPFRVDCTFHDKHGQLALDQIRASSKERLVKRMGRLDEKTNQAVSNMLVAMFMP